jgi:hypothetical protein
VKRLLCRFGLHGYRLIGFRGLVLSDWLEVCDTCGKGRVLLNFGSATMHYTPEQVRQLIKISPSPNCTPSAPPRSNPDRPS